LKNEQIKIKIKKLMGKFKITITFCPGLGTEHGNRCWKGIKQ
jgi:hypothetical protein